MDSRYRPCILKRAAESELESRFRCIHVLSRSCCRVEFALLERFRTGDLWECLARSVYDLLVASKYLLVGEAHA